MNTGRSGQRQEGQLQRQGEPGAEVDEPGDVVDELPERSREEVVETQADVQGRAIVPALAGPLVDHGVGVDPGDLQLADAHRQCRIGEQGLLAPCRLEHRIQRVAGARGHEHHPEQHHPDHVVRAVEGHEISLVQAGDEDEGGDGGEARVVADAKKQASASKVRQKKMTRIHCGPAASKTLMRFGRTRPVSERAAWHHAVVGEEGEQDRPHIGERHEQHRTEDQAHEPQRPQIQLSEPVAGTEDVVVAVGGGLGAHQRNLRGRGLGPGAKENGMLTYLVYDSGPVALSFGASKGCSGGA